MLLTPQKLLVYPLMITSNSFRNWFSMNRSLKKTFTQENKINGLCEYYYNCNIQSRYYDHVEYLSHNYEPLDKITSELYIEYGGKLYYEQFANYRFVNGNNFNYLSLINPFFSTDFFCHYNVSRDGIYYKDLLDAENDHNYIKLRDTLHEYMYKRS